ncbi:circadian clock protein KaiC [Thalassomonas haliotis]|uniref:non-specific serine/threonine protein kinase n=1 Tax=Thalassomonas haliotis TaxID=485448 RepID=A0ABY7V901_9GAMM|nr:circadian clock protein KaiC [Thalassomonas haliotis]WDE09700.1 circadian clock protein KaiC [Thalassomonas haliotis]
MNENKHQLPAEEQMVPKLTTHIEGLDMIAEGGLPKGRTTLVSGTSGCAKTILGVQFLINGIVCSEESGVFVTFEETPEDIMRNVRSFGWDLLTYREHEKLAFVDASPEPQGHSLEAGHFDFSALLARIEHAVSKVGASRVVIDSIGSLFSQFMDAGRVRQELLRIVSGLKRMAVTTLITAERTEEGSKIARYGVEEFVVDSVIILRNTREEERRRRTIEILKYRGASHHKGQFPFTISDQGIEVQPLSSMKLTQTSSTTRISTGNTILDEMCGGGFYRDSIVLLSGATGCGKTLTVTTFLYEGCRSEERTLLFAFEESREQLLRNAKGWGMDLKQWEQQGRLKIICAYPESLGLEDHLIRIKKEVAAYQPTRIAVDSLSAIERVANIKSFREFVIDLTAFIKAREIAGLFTVTTESLLGGTSITETHISSITDSIILMRYVELMGEMRRGLTILKMRGSYHDKSIREYQINDTGMHIGSLFKNVGGILAGAPRQHIHGETNKLAEMFEASS